MNGIISRQEAFRRGLPRYFSGRRCPKGHIAERRTRTYDCVECRKERKRAARRQPAPEICATPPEGPVGPSKSTSSQVTKVEPSSLVLRMNIPTGKITAHFKGARSASVSDDEMIDRLVTGQGKTELIQDWARRSVPGIVQPRPRQEPIWLKQHLPFRWCLEEALRLSRYGSGWLDLAQTLYYPVLSERYEFENALTSARWAAEDNSDEEDLSPGSWAEEDDSV